MLTHHSESLGVDELTLDLRLHNNGPVFDTVTASDFLVWIDYTFQPGYPAVTTGSHDDADPGAPDELEIKRITALGPIEFMGNYSTATSPSDLSEYVKLVIPINHDIRNLFTDNELQAMADRLLPNHI